MEEYNGEIIIVWIITERSKNNVTEVCSQFIWWAVFLMKSIGIRLKFDV